MQASRLVSLIAPASLAVLSAVAGCGPYGCPSGFVESGGRCLDPDAGVDASTEEDGGAEPEDASIDARAPLADANVDGGSETCNGMDDDGDSRVDEGDGRECAQNAVEACSTECETGGFRRCDSACMWEREGGCYADAEICNYCDDDGDGTIDDERGLATVTTETVDSCTDGWRFVSSPPGLVLIPFPCDFLWRDLVTDGTTSDAAAAWRTDSFQLAHGGIRVHASVRLSKSGATVPGEGWAIVLAEAGSGDIGDAGGALGVPYGRHGLSIEWRFSGSDGATERGDEIVVRRLTGTAPGEVIRTVSAPAGLDWGTAGRTLTQSVVVEYTPENPATAAVEERLLVEAGGELVPRTTVLDLGPCPPGRSCLTTVADEIAWRARLDVGITASTGVRSSGISYRHGGTAGSRVTLLNTCP